MNSNYYITYNECVEIAKLNQNVGEFVLEYFSTYSEQSTCKFPDGESMYRKFQNLVDELLKEVGYVGEPIEVFDEIAANYEYDIDVIKMFYNGGKPNIEMVIDIVNDYLDDYISPNQKIILFDNKPILICE